MTFEQWSFVKTAVGSSKRRERHAKEVIGALNITTSKGHG